jgi:hypothetical protein
MFLTHVGRFDISVLKYWLFLVFTPQTVCELGDSNIELPLSLGCSSKFSMKFVKMSAGAVNYQAFASFLLFVPREEHSVCNDSCSTVFAM